MRKPRREFVLLGERSDLGLGSTFPEYFLETLGLLIKRWDKRWNKELLPFFHASLHSAIPLFCIQDDVSVSLGLALV